MHVNKERSRKSIISILSTVYKIFLISKFSKPSRALPYWEYIDKKPFRKMRAISAVFGCDVGLFYDYHGLKNLRSKENFIYYAKKTIFRISSDETNEIGRFYN